MPELPEVETIKRQLSRTIVNKTMISVSAPDPRVIKDISLRSFKAKLKNKKIKEIIRRGKVLIFNLEDEFFLVFHLRIAGWIMLSSRTEHCARVIFHLSSGKDLTFCDSRVLGEVRLVKDWKQLPIIRTMGPEPEDITGKQFAALLKKRKAQIKPLLLDQRFIAGIGNIYAQEALFCAQIDPERRADTIPGKKAEKLHACLKKILKQAIARKGSSINTFRQTDGKSGGMAECFSVYQRKGEPCPVCGRPLHKKNIGGRGTCFCPCCQK